MLDFRYPEITDKDWIKEYLNVSQYMGCEYTFGNIFAWSPVFQTKIIQFKDSLITKSRGEKPAYSCPAGHGDFKSIIPDLMSDAKECRHPFKMVGITPGCIEKIESTFPGKLDFAPYRDGFDYIYLAEDLIHLKGKKYHSKRNHIAGFERENEWSFEKIDEKNLPDCIAMNEAWAIENNAGDSESISLEQQAIHRAFDNYFELDFSGGLIRVDGKPVAFTMGEKLNDETYCVHFEKAYANIRGAYPIINREFVKNVLSEYKYINREDDAGVEGLRKAKLSYHPTILLEKYLVRFKGEV